jgi:enoyl-CoA hydratase/carnithine racemase
MTSRDDSFETVLFDVDSDGVATITLNRPDVMNCFNQQMLDEFSRIWQLCRAEDDIHAIVLRAAGEHAFSTGVDRKQGRFRHPNPLSEDDPGFWLGAKQNRVWKPLILAIHGMFAGGAFYWLNECDVAICSEDATFFDPHTSYGMASALEPAGLLRRIPFGDVMRLALFGNDERISAARALSIGLVTEVLSRDQLWDRAYVLAKRLAEKPALAVQGTVKAVWDSMSMTVEASRSVPLMYTQLINPVTKTEFNPGAERTWEVR